MNKKLFCIEMLLVIFRANILLNAYESSVNYGAGLAAMGGSAVAIISEDAVTVNPSVLAFLDQKSLLLSNTQSIEKKKTYQALGIVPTKRIGWLAGYSRTSVSDIPVRDEFNRDLGRAEFFSQKVTLGSGFSYKKSIGIGSTINFATLGLDNNAFENKTSFDLGLSGHIKNWNVGLSILGWNEKSGSEIRCGLAKEGKRTMAGEIVWSLHYAPYFALSLDYEFTSIFSGKAAFHTVPQKFDHFGIFSAISAGFRLKFKQFALDYSFYPEGNIGYAHKFSLIIKSKRKVERNSEVEPFVSPKEKKSFILDEGSQSFPVFTRTASVSSFGNDGQQNQSLKTSARSPESEAVWSKFVQSAQSHFIAFSKEIEVETNKDLIIFKLKNVGCIGHNRFSSQSGIILSHIAKLLKSYPELRILIDYRGEMNEDDCASAVKKFFYNEKVESEMEVQFTPLNDAREEPFIQILVFRNQPTVSDDVEQSLESRAPSKNFITEGSEVAHRPCEKCNR